MEDIKIIPELGERLRKTLRLSKTPATVAEFIELGKKLATSTPEMAKYVEKIRAGDEVVGKTDKDRGQSVELPDRGRTKVMCAYDALATSLLYGEGKIFASCPHCGEKMEVEVKGGEIVDSSSPSILYWLGDGPKGIPLCDHFNLFPDQEHLDSWLKTNPEELGVPLSLDIAEKVIKGQIDI